MAARLPSPTLCLVTDRSQCLGRSLEEVVAQAVVGGVNLVQLREKDLPAKKLLDLALRLREITSGKALLFINDRADVALACDADGVQLGEEGLPVEATRKLSEGRLLLGRSVHSVEGAQKAVAHGADVLIVGTIFPTTSHPDAVAGGVELLERVRDHVNVPFLAIGGVKAENIFSVIQGGALGAAVITAVARSPDAEIASRELMNRMKQALASMPGPKAVRRV